MECFSTWELHHCLASRLVVHVVVVVVVVDNDDDDDDGRLLCYKLCTRMSFVIDHLQSGVLVVLVCLCMSVC